MTNQELAKVANEVRKGVVTAVHAAKSGHPGGSLGAADIMTYLYFEEMNIDPADPHKADRDRFVLSKGHAAPGLYSVLANRGYFPVEELETLRHIGSRLQGHPNMNDTPGIDMSTGSLGQGISAAVGMALAAKHWGDGYRVYTLLGDGECEEGQVWEAAMFAGNHALDNLVAVVDHNGLQIDGTIDEVNSAMPLADKFRAFKWHVIELADGNDMAQIAAAFAGCTKQRVLIRCAGRAVIRGCRGARSVLSVGCLLRSGRMLRPKEIRGLGHVLPNRENQQAYHNGRSGGD